MPETLPIRVVWVIVYVFLTIVAGWFFVRYTHMNNSTGAGLIMLMLIAGIWFSLSNRIDNEVNPPSAYEGIREVPDDDVEDDVGD